MSGAATASAAPRSLRGHCAPPALAELIRDLYLEERTGTLVIGRSGVEKQLILDRGMILAATSSLEDERLPAWLLTRGLIPKSEADKLRRLDDRQVAEAVVQRGGMNADTLATAIRELGLQVLTAVFRWEEMDYQFVEGDLVAWPFTTNAVQSFEMIIRALRSMAGFEPVREAVLRQERAIRMAEDQYLPFDRIPLSPIEGYLVSRIDGRTRARDIVAQVPSSDEETGTRFLFGLLILGLAQFYPPLGPGMLSCAHLLKGDEDKRRREETEIAEVRACYALVTNDDPATLLGVPAGATQDDIRAAYEQKKERFSAARFLKRVQVELREELQIIEARLLEAFLALRTRPLDARKNAGGSDAGPVDVEALGKRKELTKTVKQSDVEEAHRLAGIYLTRARDFWKLGDVYSCIRYCEFARTHNPGDAAVHSLLGQALARNPDHRWQRRAEAALIRAAQLESFNPAHWYNLGEFYRHNRLHGKARRLYEKTLQLAPTHVEAQQALRDLPKGKD
jgi:tetratricopeptide (TPR) repeat protein